MKIKILILLISIVSLSVPAVAQYFSFKSYNIDEGLPQSTVEDIIQDSRGYLWVATHGGAAKFDGYKFEDFSTKEGLANNYVFDIEEDRFGNIWFATNGGVTVYSASEIEPQVYSFTEKEGVASNRVMSLVCAQDQVIFGTTKGLCSINIGKGNENPFAKENLKMSVGRIYPALNDERIRCLFIDSHQQLWVGTNGSGVVKVGENMQYYSEEEGIPNKEVLTINEDNDGNIWVGTISGLAKMVYVNESVTSIISEEQIGTRNKTSYIRSMYFDSDGTLYLSYPYFAILRPSTTAKIGYKLDEGFAAKSEIYSNSTQSILKDREGNIWLGGGSAGLSKFMGAKFEAYTNYFGMSGNSIRGIVQNDSGDYWFATNRFASMMKGGIDKANLTYDELQFIEEIGPDKGVGTNSIWSLCHDSKNNIWIGGVRGAYKYDGKEYKLFSDKKEFLGKAVMRIYEDNHGTIWFSTFEGVTCYNLEKDSIYSPFDEADLLYGKRIAFFYQDKNDDYWFGGRDGLVRLKNGVYKFFGTKHGLPNNYVSLIVPDQFGNLWLATGKGISMFDGQKFTNYSTQEGLSSDTPYLMVFDDDWNLWVGTNKGLDRLTIDPENSLVTNIKFYGKDEGFMGLETNSNAALKDANGDLWFGTVEGAIKYQKKYDTGNNVQPKTHITRLRINYEDAPLKDSLVLTYQKNDLIFDYTGISLSNPKKVRYKYRLIGLDEEWSPEVKETYVSFSNLSDGEYTFQVVSCNNDGIWNDNPTEFNFVITPPFWRTIWFYGLLIIIIFSAIYSYVKVKTKRLKETKRVLENKVKERTNELFKEHEKLEIAYAKIEENNNNITSSIRYAKRIQDSILPTNRIVSQVLPESFVFYQPKDIISGDFYWVEDVGNTAYFAAVDCTGHGVPGALMSIVGHGALNQAIYGKSIAKPGDILVFLNKVVNQTLRQKAMASEIVRDGMDIALGSLNKETNILNYAGAYNPLWIIRNGELIEVKGDRKPIGNYAEKTNEAFTNHEIQLEKGDVLYLFSDGFADQFGGLRGKKYKIAQFRRFIKSIAKSDLTEQKKLLKEEFDNWKGNHEQIDDVCIIGVKI